MAKGEAETAAVSSGWVVRASILGWLLLGCAAGIAGCDDRLPGFADPPPVDAGDAGDSDAEAADDDAG
jgi:hypothetical protein